MSMMSQGNGLKMDVSHGFSLIEVMVTIVIVSFGLLGIAGMVFSSVSSGKVSMSRSVAVNLANEMGDKIRSNWLAVKGGSFDAIAYDAYAGNAACDGTCMLGTCTADNQAQMDICLWKKQLNHLLPAGSGQIVVDPNNPRCTIPSRPCIFTLSVRWTEGTYSTSSDVAKRDVTFQTAPTVYSLSVQP